MSRTDMVRCKSLVEQMRVIIAGVMSRGDGDGEQEYLKEAGAESAAEDGGISSAWVDEAFDMDVARVYENTIVKLGEVLADGGGIGDL